MSSKIFTPLLKSRLSINVLKLSGVPSNLNSSSSSKSSSSNRPSDFNWSASTLYNGSSSSEVVFDFSPAGGAKSFAFFSGVSTSSSDESLIKSDNSESKSKSLVSAVSFTRFLSDELSITSPDSPSGVPKSGL